MNIELQVQLLQLLLDCSDGFAQIDGLLTLMGMPSHDC